MVDKAMQVRRVVGLDRPAAHLCIKTAELPMDARKREIKTPFLHSKRPQILVRIGQVVDEKCSFD